MKKDFLLEIGCENLPSGYLDDMIEQARKLFEEGIGAERIPCDGIAVMGTPKRIVLLARGLAVKQENAEEKIVGPPVKVAVASDGSFTKAAEGFAKSQGVPTSALARVETPKGAYLAVVKRIKGQSTASIMRERLPQWIQRIRAPKTMRWTSGGMRFARPIRWILCLFGSEVVRVKAGGLVAGRRTRLSPLFEKTIPVKTVDDYFSLMRGNGIVLEPAARRDAVRAAAGSCARSQGGALVEDEDLVGIVANLLESPVAMAGRYDEGFLALPREVIVTALKSHQRYFSVAGPRGELVPHFVAFADGERSDPAGIVKGYERVLRARLDDAVFYYREDTSAPFEKMAGKLDGIVWLEGLGSLAGKASRIEALALWMASTSGIADEKLDRSIRRSALLAKADLASEMVKDGKEFTALQGYIGREYARVSGEEEEVAEAIYEHYLPRFAGDRMPHGETSALLALADKIDTITGCFRMGLEPSGSQDPYALRRHAMGVLRILIARRSQLPLPKALDRSIGLYADALKDPSRDRGKLLEQIREFYAQRLYTIVRGEGVDHDLAAAVLASPWEYPHAVKDMADELQGLRKSGELSAFVLAMKRVTNIIPRTLRDGYAEDIGMNALEAFSAGREDELGFSSTLFLVDAEKKLNDEMSHACRKLLDAKRSGQVQHSIGILKGIVPYVNKFFDDVLVNCEDEKIRNNRIAFLASSYRAVMVFCDFAQIAGE
ncbi:MAG: glycine--tRNA ligase subunit beta [Candidatus Krumholzibacteria bacterium]|nr:glycine--tRNA ligase subunit beta [Candidatus Krumholzibacteria bacterium]